MEIALWNVLHDGELVEVSGQLPGSLRLVVEIEYLCSSLPTESTQLIVLLTTCTCFEYQPFDGVPLRELSAFGPNSLTFLSARVADSRVVVQCADGGGGGELLLQYSQSEVTTLEGSCMSQDELELASDGYWDAWEKGSGREGLS